MQHGASKVYSDLDAPDLPSILIRRFDEFVLSLRIAYEHVVTTEEEQSVAQ